MKKAIYVLVGASAVLLIAGGYFFLKSDSGLVGAYSTSTQAVLNTTAKRVSVAINPTGASATTTSIYNGDSTDRLVIGSFAGCTGANVTAYTFLTGAGLASVNVKAATTSTDGATNGLQGNVNYVANVNIATATAVTYTSSTTEPVLGPIARIWPSGTYMTYLMNGTSTMSCTVGSDYISL